MLVIGLPSAGQDQRLSELFDLDVVLLQVVLLKS